jgi:hypothetical protein
MADGVKRERVGVGSDDQIKAHADAPNALMHQGDTIAPEGSPARIEQLKNEKLSYKKQRATLQGRVLRGVVGND